MYFYCFALHMWGHVANLTKKLYFFRLSFVREQNKSGFLWITSQSVFFAPTIFSAEFINEHRVSSNFPINRMTMSSTESCVLYPLSSSFLISQSGYRKRNSCETALNLVIAKWKVICNEGDVIIAVFLDLKVAFETIDRGRLI